MVSIWFFIGISLLVNGLLIFAAGLYEYWHPPALDGRVQLFELHAGAILDIFLGVVADAHREELEQLAPVVFVVNALGVVVVVEPEDHGWIHGDLDEQRAKVAQRVLAEHRNLVGHHLGVVELAKARREEVMPEEREFFLERATRVDHPVHPERLRRIELARLFHVGVVAEYQVFLEFGGRLRVEQLLDSSLVSLRLGGFELIACSAEACATEQVADELDAREALYLRTAKRDCHTRVPLLLRLLKPQSWPCAKPWGTPLPRASEHTSALAPGKSTTQRCRMRKWR